MTFIRARLLSSALALLACQLGLAAAAPVAVCRAGAPLAAAPGSVMCTCEHAEAAECPMHKGTARPETGGESDTSRWYAGCAEQMFVILSVMAGSAGILQVAEQALDPMTTGVRLTMSATPTLDATRPPTPPPPRS